MSEEKKKPERSKNFIPEEIRREIYETILEKMAIGYVDHEIRREIENKYGITFTTAKKYISQVRTQLKNNQAAIQNDDDLNLSMAIMRLETLYKKALEADKFEVAERILRQLHQLQGLNAQLQAPGMSVYVNNSTAGHIGNNMSNLPTNVLEAEYRKNLPQRLTQEGQPVIPTVMNAEYAKKILKEEG